MKQNIKTTKLTKLALIFSICVSLTLFGIFSVSEAAAKLNSLSLSEFAVTPNPLSLGDVLTGLRSKKTTLAKRNKLLTTAVKQRGITFKLNSEIEKELKSAGANAVLMEAIRQKSPITPDPNVKPVGVMNTFDVEFNVMVGGKKGMYIRPNFTVYNMQNIGSQFIIEIETSTGVPIKAVSSKYASTSGNLIVGDRFTPCCDVAAYTDFSYFIPYSEINLGTGNYDLRLNINITYSNGTVITPFEYYNFTYRVG